jgi:DNA polymerase-3 subunit beta
VLPQSNGFQVILDAAPFREALERVSLMGSENHHGIKLALEPATGGDTGEATESVDASYAGDPFRIGFNSELLRNLLGVVRRGPVEISEGRAERG